MNSSTQRTRGRDKRSCVRAAWLCSIIGLACLHLILLQYFMPLRVIWADAPIYGVDFDLHIGQVFRVVDAIERYGHTWLYDVQLLAGQPEGTITDAGSKGWELWTYALHHYLGFPRAVAFNAFVLVAMLAPPGLIYAAGRLLRLSGGASVLAAAMASTLWYFDSHIHWLWFIGMVSWALASCLALVTFGLFYRLTEDEQLGFALPCALCLAVGLLIHPYTFFVLVAPMATCYIRKLRHLGALVHVAVVGIVGIALAVNSFWLANALRHWHYILNSAYFAQARPKFLICDLLSVLCSAADTGVIGTRTGFRLLYLGFAIAGLLLWRRERDRRALPVGVALCVLYVIAYFGGYILGLSQTQPYRQITPAIWLTTIPAAYFLRAGVANLRWDTFSLTLKLGLSVLTCVLMQQLITSQVMYFLPRLIPDPEPLLDGTLPPLSKYGFWALPGVQSHVHYGLPHDATVEPGLHDVLDWAADNLSPRSRVLVEGGLLGERMAWSTSHEVLGGFVERNVEHVDANFFRRYAHRVATRAELAEYLQVYAVEWVIGNRPEFERAEDLLVLVTSVGGRNVYQVKVPGPRLTGGGVVRAQENQIDVRGSSPGLPVLLAYHFHEALRCRPSCSVQRERVNMDRVGLIRVPAPHPADFTIYNSYEFSETDAGTSARDR